MQRALHFDGNLQISDGRREYTVVGSGTGLRAEIGDLRTDVFSLLRMGVSVQRARRLSRELVRRGLTLVITRKGIPVAELGAGVRAGFLARLIGFPHLRFFKNRLRGRTTP